MYSDSLLALFHQPGQRRQVRDWQRQARFENPICGDVLEMQARFKESRIEELGFGGHGCPPLIAAAEWICRWAPGRERAELLELNEEKLELALGGLPKNKRHALNLCLEALAEICREMPQGV